MNNTNIQIVEKPDWISWEDVKRCLIDAHAENRSKGINMTHYLWPAEKIQSYIEDYNGEMFVALDGGRVIGTAAYRVQTGAEWYRNGKFAYLCFDSVLPTYKGQGVWESMSKERDKSIIGKGIKIFFFDTNIKNTRRISIGRKTGFHLVDAEFYRDHYSVKLAKWQTERHSTFVCYSHFLWAMAKSTVQRFVHTIRNKK